MRVAVIDVGTNSTRLLVADEQQEGFRSLERRMIVTRLGQGVDSRRILAPEALQRTLSVIADYAAICGEYGVQRLRVTGTSAVRDAHNRDEVFDGVRTLTGQEPELLTGDEEATATFLGACAELDPDEPKLVVDIGGGSTEFIVGAEAPERLISIDIGCVRMLEKFLRSDPPTAEELAEMREYVDAELERVKEVLQAPRGSRLIGVAGTVTQLATLKAGLPVYDPDVTHHAVLTHGDVRRLARRLTSLPFAQRQRVKALEAGRVDVIVPGAHILLYVMEAFDAAEVLVSEKDILDGLVLQLFEA